MEYKLPEDKLSLSILEQHNDLARPSHYNLFPQKLESLHLILLLAIAFSK